MRLRNKPWAKEKIAQYPQYVVENPAQYKGKWLKRFQNNNPIHIEIGTGKGRFITEMAKLHPHINFIGIELQTSVVVVALDKLIEAQLPNLQLLHVNGGDVREFFQDNEIDRIYLNFSDPWPKKRHEKRRLTSTLFLNSYEHILNSNGHVCLKTDNQGLFEYSLASFSQYGMILDQVWLDLHNSDFKGNVMTEYEEKFSSRNQRIYRVKAHFKKKEGNE